MKMLNIVCGEKLEGEILAMFKDLGIKGYTVIAGVGGTGQTGTVSGTGGSIDRNTLFMVALDPFTRRHMSSRQVCRQLSRLLIRDVAAAVSAAIV